MRRRRRRKRIANIYLAPTVCQILCKELHIHSFTTYLLRVGLPDLANKIQDIQFNLKFR